MKKIRILIADDHSVIRSGLKTLLKRSNDFLVVGEASNGEEAIAMTAACKPHVVILDISMPKLNGIEATRELKQRYPSVKVLILTIHEDEGYVYQIMRAGADGYLLKNSEKKKIFAAIYTVAGGDLFFSVDVSGFIRDRLSQQEQRRPSPTLLPKAPLTKREIEILRFIALGYTNREIAAVLHLSIFTINTHRTNLMEKLDIHETAGLVRYAVQNGFITIENIK